MALFINIDFCAENENEIKVKQILIKKKQLDSLHSLIYFSNKSLPISESSSVHHQYSNNVHTAIHSSYADRMLAGCHHNLYDI